MFFFRTLSAAFRAAAAAVRAGSFTTAVTTVADAMDQLGFPEDSAKLRAEIEGAAEGDRRKVAVNALGLLADSLSAFFGFAPIVVMSAQPGAAGVTSVDDARLCGKLEHLAACCEALDAPKAAASAGDPAQAISPAMLQVILAFVGQIFANWVARRHLQPT